MVKLFTIHILIIMLFASSFQWMFVCGGFRLNKQYIAANLCVNRNKPWLHCNGKCYFMRKLKQTQDKEKKEESQSQKNLLQEAFCTAPQKVKFHTYVLRTIPIPNGKVILPRVAFPIFHPPQIG